MAKCMDNFWNYLHLPTPVILSVKINSDEAFKTVSQMKVILKEIKRTMNDLTQLNLEAATLSRLIYRMKYKLRQEKSFKCLQRINRCLTNYLTMHLPQTLSTIDDTLYEGRGPSRQLLEWALVRLYGVAQLFHRVYQLCVDAAGHLFVRIKLAHLWEHSFFSIATVSRIWTFAQFIVMRACRWYRSLHQFLDKLGVASVPWLPDNCVLPHHLADSLGNPPYLKKTSLNKPSNLLSHLKTTVPHSTDDLTNKIAEVIDLNMFEDIGESVSRDLLPETFTQDKINETVPVNRKKGKRKHNVELEVAEKRLKITLDETHHEAIKNTKSSKLIGGHHGNKGNSKTLHNTAHVPLLDRKQMKKHKKENAGKPWKTTNVTEQLYKPDIKNSSHTSTFTGNESAVVHDSFLKHLMRNSDQNLCKSEEIIALRPFNKKKRRKKKKGKLMGNKNCF